MPGDAPGSVTSVWSAGASTLNTPSRTSVSTEVPAVSVAPLARGMCPTSTTVDGPRAVRNATWPVRPVTVVPFAMGLVPLVPLSSNSAPPAIIASTSPVVPVRAHTPRPFAPSARTLPPVTAMVALPLPKVSA